METADGSHQAKPGGTVRSRPTAQRGLVMIVALLILAGVVATLLFVSG